MTPSTSLVVQSPHRIIVTMELLLILVLVSFIYRGEGSIMVTTNETITMEMRSTVILPCEFLMNNFSMFENPIIWNKRQVVTEEDIQVNIMGNILEPFLSTHRFQATLEKEDPRYRMTLRITEFSPEDVGNYSCEVRGRRSIVMGKVHHTVTIRALTIEMSLELGNTSSPTTGTSPLIKTILHDFPAAQKALVFMENKFQPIACTSRGFNPHQDLRISLSDTDVSSSFDEIKLTSFAGVKGLHVVQYTIIRTSFNLTFAALDDDRPITCSVSLPGLPTNKTKRIINVIHKPHFKCPETTAYLGETNVFLWCLVRARPPVTTLYWDFHHNDTTTSRGNNFTPDIDEYWSTVTDRNDGWMETKFFIRHVTNQSFKSYKVLSENQLGVGSMLVRLRQVNKPLPYESRLQSDNPSWQHKSNPSLEYVVIRSAPNQPSSFPPRYSPSLHLITVCTILSTILSTTASRASHFGRIIQLLLKFPTSSLSFVYSCCLQP